MDISPLKPKYDLPLIAFLYSNLYLLMWMLNACSRSTIFHYSCLIYMLKPYWTVYSLLSVWVDKLSSTHAMMLWIVAELEYMKENVVAIKIAYGQLTYEYMEENVRYTGKDLLGKIIISRLNLLCALVC